MDKLLIKTSEKSKSTKTDDLISSINVLSGVFCNPFPLTNTHFQALLPSVKEKIFVVKHCRKIYIGREEFSHTSQFEMPV